MDHASQMFPAGCAQIQIYARLLECDVLASPSQSERRCAHGNHLRYVRMAIRAQLFAPRERDGKVTLGRHAVELSDLC